MSPVFMFLKLHEKNKIRHLWGKQGCDRFMLKEYLSDQKKQFYTLGQRHKGDINLPICSASGRGRMAASIPVCTEPLHFEAFFCTKGRLVIQPLRHDTCVLEAPGIFFTF